MTKREWFEQWHERIRRWLYEGAEPTAEELLELREYFERRATFYSHPDDRMCRRPDPRKRS